MFIYGSVLYICVCIRDEGHKTISIHLHAMLVNSQILVQNGGFPYGREECYSVQGYICIM